MSYLNICSFMFYKLLYKNNESDKFKYYHQIYKFIDILYKFIHIYYTNTYVHTYINLIKNQAIIFYLISLYVALCIP